MKTKKIYSYDPLTGILRGEGVADPDPMEKGKYLIPDFATTQKPPKAKKGFFVAWVNGSGWEQKESPKLQPAPPKPEPTAEELAAQVKGKRNRLLSACDYTQLQDAPLTADQRSAWQTYRQALRDITAQKGFPAKVKFPEPPTA